jgi:CBS domain-containing protein
MTLTDLVHTDVPTAAPETPVADIAAALRREGDELVAVLDEGRPLGLLTAADIGRAFVGDEDLDASVARDLLEGDPMTIRESAERADLVSLLAAADGRRAIVVDREDAFVGVVSVADVVAAYGREFTEILKLFE